jgi:putative ABC transport system ATP-binding protein
VATWLFDPEPVLRLDGVNKAYGHGTETVHALRDATLLARAGEVVGLVGRSGSGKTTLLNVAAGWEMPDDGVVEAPGDATPGWSEIAVLPQRLGLMDELSALENVEYPARMKGVLAERRHLIDDLIEALGLAALRSRYPKETSLGEQQRIALARALVLRPRLLIADEPTGHQDAGWAARIMGIIREAAGAGSCCVIATHDTELIGQLDRGFSMTDGRLSDLPR